MGLKAAWQHTHLPKDALVLLAQIDEGVAGLAMPYVWQASFAANAQVVADDLGAPACPHIVIATNGLALTHEAKVQSWANELPAVNTGNSNLNFKHS